MHDTIEKRVSDIEAILTDLPEIINLRFERVNSTLSEHTARLGLLDRQLATLLRDVRDLRGGVTRQLVGQDARLAGIEQRLVAQDGRLAAIEQRFGAVENQLVAQDGRLAAIEQRFGAVEQRLDEILSRLPKSR